MNPAPTAGELALLRQSVRQTLATLRTGSPDECWPQSWTADWEVLAEQGLWSTIEPPDGSLAAAAVVVEELGGALYPGPACEALAAAYVLHRLCGGDALRALADGHPSAALVTGGLTVDTSTPAIGDGELDPAVRVAADTLLIVVTAHGELVASPAAEAHSYAAPTLDVSRDIAVMVLRNLPVDRMTSPEPETALYGRAARSLLYCADTLGCVEHVLGRTAEYASQRSTFGSPIAKYQAVAHRLVDHAVAAQQMRLVLDAAIAAFDGRADDVALQVATTETFFAGRSTDIISDCIQLAGAIGFTWEFGQHFYLRRVVANATLAGGVGRAHHRLAKEASW